MRPNEDLLKIAKQLCHDFDVALYLNGGSEAYCYPARRAIFYGLRFPSDKTQAHFLSTICHEICHVLCLDFGKFVAYHDSEDEGVYTKKGLKQELISYRTCLEAELYVDNMAKKLFKLYFPTLKFDRAYITAKSRRNLRLKNRRYYLKYKHRLEKLNKKR